MFDARSFSSVAFQIGSFRVYWYGISYVIGLALALFQAKWICRKYAGLVSIPEKDMENFFPWACLAIVVGGRLGHILFFDPAYYFSHLKEWLNIRQGGMSFHGGLLGVILAAVFFCYKKKLNYFRFADIAATVAPIGLFFGRIANFINNELCGKPTTMPWGTYFRDVEGPRHPVQLYEAFCEGFLLFLLAQILWRTHFCKKHEGLIFASFLIGYALFRFFIDFLKDTPILCFLTVGQWLSIGMLFLAALLLWVLFNKEKSSQLESH